MGSLTCIGSRVGASGTRMGVEWVQCTSRVWGLWVQSVEQSVGAKCECGVWEPSESKGKQSV